MKKKLLRNVSLVMITGLLIVSLSACGGSKDINNAKSDEPISASEAFNQEGIWFGSDDLVTKDERIDYILVFDGKGNVTRYETSAYSEITYTDLKGLSNEEIIELAKERDKITFDELIENEVSDGNYIISIYRNRVNNTNASQQSRNENQMYLDASLALASKMEEAPYQEPEAYPFTLEIETDGTGNQTSSEKLKYSYLGLDFNSTANGFRENLTMDEVNQWEAYQETEAELNLYPGAANMTVYDMQFNGFSGLYLLVEEDQTIFVLDSPDAEGVKVD